MSQALYPIIGAIIQWITGNNDEISLAFTLNEFSLAYTCIILSVILFFIVSFGNIEFFIKINSYGTIFLIFMICFIVYHGAISLTNTNFTLSDTVVESMRLSKIDLFKTNFGPLAGISTLGFCLHTVSLPILKNNKDKKNNVRDLFLGYALTCA